MTQMLTAVNQRLLAIPSPCARPLVGKTDISEIAELIRVELYSALKELSECDAGMFEATGEGLSGQFIGAAGPEASGSIDGSGSSPSIEEET
jgi:hypothetical protein